MIFSDITQMLPMRSISLPYRVSAKESYNLARTSPVSSLSEWHILRLLMPFCSVVASDIRGKSAFGP